MMFATDSSTFIVYDLGALKHRLDNACDWWTIPEEAAREMNQGNVAIVDLGTDGLYSVEIWNETDLLGQPNTISFLLKIPTGRAFLGSGDERTGGGLEPTCLRGGAFQRIRKKGTFRLLVQRLEDYRLAVSLTPHEGPAANSFTGPVKLPS